ncbi:response regulator transcription factor [Erythrobacter aureus]|uniref:Response regulator n=1 Tax=Erythrobacter aureus TaxID=2182384 RepID=A0A345YJ33_9SPHN|nr:response regulator [Erythrobacter aureus]AXK43935.1 response regulator [Erythrobacter aureus]
MDSNLVHIVDDDEQIRNSLQFLLMTHKLNSRQFTGGRDFLRALPSLESGCILLDVRMPDMDGLQMMKMMRPCIERFSVIVMTGHGDVATAVEAMKLGAIDFIEKPFDEEALVRAVKAAQLKLGERIGDLDAKRDAEDRLAELTPRAKEVLGHLMGGHSNKVVAKRMDVSPRTVEMHRSNIFQKLGVKSLSEAVRLACMAGFVPQTEEEAV